MNNEHNFKVVSREEAHAYLDAMLEGTKVETAVGPQATVSKLVATDEPNKVLVMIKVEEE